MEQPSEFQACLSSAPGFFAMADFYPDLLSLFPLNTFRSSWNPRSQISIGIWMPRAKTSEWRRRPSQGRNARCADWFCREKSGLRNRPHSNFEGRRGVIWGAESEREPGEEFYPTSIWERGWGTRSSFLPLTSMSIWNKPETHPLVTVQYAWQTLGKRLITNGCVRNTFCTEHLSECF